MRALSRCHRFVPRSMARSAGMNVSGSVAAAGATAALASRSQEMVVRGAMPLATPLDAQNLDRQQTGDYYASSSFEAALNQVLELERDSPTKGHHQPSFETAVRDFFRV